MSGERRRVARRTPENWPPPPARTERATAATCDSLLRPEAEGGSIHPYAALNSAEGPGGDCIGAIGELLHGHDAFQSASHCVMLHLRRPRVAFALGSIAVPVLAKGSLQAEERS
jgi:hypothetical protein